MTLELRMAPVLASVLMWSCAGPLAPVPRVSLDGVVPGVRDAVLDAHQRAVAEPRSAQASGRLGMVLQANTLFAPAVESYQRAVQLEPKEFRWRYYLALALEQQSELEAAVDAMTAALRLRPDYAPAVVKRGELLFKLGRLKESSAALEPLLAEHPNSAPALYTLAQVKYAEEDFAAAEQLYRRACQSYPSFGSAYYGLAVTLKGLGNDAEAGKNFVLAERHKGDGPRGDDPVLGEMLGLAAGLVSEVDQGQRLMQQGNMAEASRLFQDVLKRDPDNLDGLLKMLYVGPVDGQPSEEQMGAYYERARRLAPNNPQLYLYYGMTLTSFSRYEVAIETLNQAVELKPDFAEAYALRGIIWEKSNRPGQAIEQYRRAIEVQPTYRPAHLQLARLLIGLGRHADAIAGLQPLLGVPNPDTPLVMVFLAQAYAGSGDAGRARGYLEQARAQALRTGPPALLQQIDQSLSQLTAAR